MTRRDTDRIEAIAGIALLAFLLWLASWAFT
jgi:hypothetical protein